MTQTTTPKQLFEHELQDVYYAARRSRRCCPKLASEATARDLSRAFESHLRETREQIKNLELVFSELGKSAKGEACPGIDGIKAEHDKFMQEESPTNDIRDLFLTGAAARTELRRAAYTGLISMARKLGEKEVVELLNKCREKEALKKVETISKKDPHADDQGERRRDEDEGPQRADRLAIGVGARRRPVHVRRRRVLHIGRESDEPVAQRLLEPLRRDHLALVGLVMAGGVSPAAAGTEAPSRARRTRSLRP